MITRYHQTIFHTFARTTRKWAAIAVLLGAAAAATASAQTLTEWGQWSTGTTRGATPASVSPDLASLEYRAIAAGPGHSLALKTDGTVVAWGHDDHGEIDVPTKLNNVIAIAAGSTHSVALKSDGTVVVWGDAGVNTPTGLTDVVAIGAGDHYTLALQSTGHVVAFGTYGPVVDGAASLPDAAVALAAGPHHALALYSDNTLRAWGDNSAGQTTIPGTITGQTTTFTGIAAGTSHSAVIDQLGYVTIWGDHAEVRQLFHRTSLVAAGDGCTWGVENDGQLWQDGNCPVAANPVPGGLTAIAAAGSSALTLQGAAPMARWISGTLEPLAVTPNAYRRLAAVGDNALGIDAKGGVGYTAPDSAGFSSINAWTSPLNIKRLTVFPETLALSTDRLTWFAGTEDSSWNWEPLGSTSVTHDVGYASRMRAGGAGFFAGIGLNGAVALDDYGNVTAGVRPVQSGNDAHAKFVSAGGVGYAGVNADGTIFEKNWAYCPALSAPASLSRAVPGPGFKSVATGYAHNLALRSDGTVTAWGCDSNGETAVPPGLSNVMAVAAGKHFSMALKSDGTLVTWGLNGSPIVPAGLTGVVAIAAGDTQSLVLTKAVAGINVDASPSVGQTITINAGLRNSASAAALPARLAWTPDYTGTVAAPLVWDDGAPTRYAFLQWSDGVASNSRAINGSFTGASYVAQYKPQYLLNIETNPAGIAVAARAAYYDAKSLVPVTAPVAGGLWFNGWSGAVTSASASINVQMSGPQTLTANYTAVPTLALPPIAAPAARSQALAVQVTVGPPGAVFTGSLQVQVNGQNAGGPIPVSGPGTYSVAYSGSVSAGSVLPVAATLTYTGAVGIRGTSGTVTQSGSVPVSAAP